MSETAKLELFTSLYDLANTSTDSIAVLKSRLTRQGIYLFTCTVAGLKQLEQTDPTKQAMIMLTIEGIIDFFSPLNVTEDDADAQASAEQMIGKAYRESFPMFMSDYVEAVGLLKGKYVSAGLPASGIPGGIEGVEGWIDGAVGNRIASRVTHKNVKDDTRVYYNWMGSKALKKLGISWDEMGRDEKDVHGNVIEQKED